MNRSTENFTDTRQQNVIAIDFNNISSTVGDNTSGQKYYMTDNNIIMSSIVAALAEPFFGRTTEVEKSNSNNDVRDTGNIEGASKMDNQDMFFKYIDIVDKDRREMEARLREERVLSEKRLEDSYSKLEVQIDNVNDKLDAQKNWTIGIFVATVAIIVASYFGIAAMIR